MRNHAKGQRREAPLVKSVGAEASDSLETKREVGLPAVLVLGCLRRVEQTRHHSIEITRRQIVAVTDGNQVAASANSGGSAHREM